MKGVILAGGTGSRLFPLTTVTNKHLLPVYKKPMIYYPLECMAKAGIEEVMLVCGGNNAGDYIRLLGNGHEFGLKHLTYTYQPDATGIAAALGLCERYVDGEPIMLILGDNVLEYSIKQQADNFRQQLAGNDGRGAKILLAEVDNPKAYGVAEMDGETVKGIIEKPDNPKSNKAVIGVYFYDGHVFDIVKTLKPSGRGELEITDVNNAYIDAGTMTADAVHGWWGDCGENLDFYHEAGKKIAEIGANKDV
ncbi:MAG: sugar phosphate nucleotidyltransferase [Planctomycetota bacterium]